MSFDVFIEGARLLMQPGPLLAIPAGAFIGLFFGLIPGLGGSVALSIVLAFVLFMDPVTAIALMVSIYATDQYGGAVTGILLNIPGTGGATATAVEGYQLTKQGRAGEALAMGRSAAFVGSIVGAVTLLLLAPLIARLALRFGAPEFFMLALFGVTVVAALSRRHLIKSLVAGLIGFLMATVGQSSATPYPRFAFNNPDLFSGLNLVWVIVGLFALSQAYLLAFGQERPTRYEGKIDVPWFKAWKQLWGYKRFVAMGSITGTIIGMIPGAGATIAAWLAYGQAQKMSKDPSRFGKGAMEGVVAPEAANDSVAGGTLIPTMTLGIPGSAGSAVILGGLILAGMRPGPRMFEEQAASAVAVMLAFLLANVVFLAIVVVAMRFFIRILTIPQGAWPPLIIVLGVFGAFVIERRMFGAYATLAVGLVAYLMVRYGYPLPPALLAFVLGPILENNWVRMVAIARGDMMGYLLGRPIALFFLALTIASLGLDAWQRRQAKRATPESVTT